MYKIAERPASCANIHSSKTSQHLKSFETPILKTLELNSPPLLRCFTMVRIAIAGGSGRKSIFYSLCNYLSLLIYCSGSPRSY